MSRVETERALLKRKIEMVIGCPTMLSISQTLTILLFFRNSCGHESPDRNWIHGRYRHKENGTVAVFILPFILSNFYFSISFQEFYDRNNLNFNFI